MPDVNATIEAAWIAAGVGALGVVGTAVTAYLGFHNTRKATEATIAAGSASTTATLAAAREERLWDKRASAYEETLAEVLHRRTNRHFGIRLHRVDKDYLPNLKEILARYETVESFQVRSRLMAYASDQVLGAFEASETADVEVVARFRRWRMLAEDGKQASESGRPSAAHDGQETIDIGREIRPALDEAEAKDEALIELIRDELRSHPEAAVLPAPLSHTRHGLLHRNRE